MNPIFLNNDGLSWMINKTSWYINAYDTQKFEVPLAQSVEHRAYIALATGSSPVRNNPYIWTHSNNTRKLLNSKNVHRYNTETQNCILLL